MFLHVVAKAYGTDPSAVLGWSPFRLGLARECLLAAQALADRRTPKDDEGNAVIFPVFVLGGL